MIDRFRINVDGGNKMNSFDARVRYTRMVLEESFLTLLEKKPMERITVTELCQTAQINRATFYKHYLDVKDLMEKMEEDLFQQIRESFAQENLKLRAFLVKMMYYTLDNRRRFMTLGGENGDPDLMTKTFRVCYEQGYPLMSRNLGHLTEQERLMLFAYLSSGAGAVLTTWIRTGMQESPEAVAQILLSLCSITADGVLQKDWREHYQE